MFFNIGGPEVLVIAIVALIAVGPEQLPVVLRKLGRFYSQVRSTTAGLRDEFMAGLDGVTEVADEANPNNWLQGKGTSEDPIVPRGFADGRGEDESNGTGTTRRAGPGTPRRTSATDMSSTSDGFTASERSPAKRSSADVPRSKMKPSSEKPDVSDESETLPLESASSKEPEEPEKPDDQGPEKQEPPSQ